VDTVEPAAQAEYVDTQVILVPQELMEQADIQVNQAGQVLVD
jgi:hypothetical protein